ncbi:MAG TPA: TetR/AcrR family transcriptional regulator [Methylomirabilota bacterium]|nr:TetR/AcrR family transcriptional regulator [Methylomirabilota bacterium]
MRRAEVLETTRRLFARKGYQRTTMVEVASASEVALGTLYQIFPSKEAMLCSLLEDYIDQLIERVRQAAAEAGDAPAQLRRVVRTQLAFSLQNADVLRFYLSGWTGYEFTVRQRFGERIDDKYEEYLRLLESVFRRGARDGVFVGGPPRRLAVTLAGMIHAVVRRWLREKSLDLVAEGEALAELLLHGVVRNGSRR